jgi:hypothetical protein
MAEAFARSCLVVHRHVHCGADTSRDGGVTIAGELPWLGPARTAHFATAEKLQSLHRERTLLLAEIRQRLDHDLTVLPQQRQLRVDRLKSEAHRLAASEGAVEGSVAQGQAYVLRRAARREAGLIEEDQRTVQHRLVGQLDPTLLDPSSSAVQGLGALYFDASSEAAADGSTFGSDSADSIASADLLRDLDLADFGDDCQSGATLLEERRQHLQDRLEARENAEPQSTADARVPHVAVATSAAEHAVAAPVHHHDQQPASPEAQRGAASWAGDDPVPVVPALAKTADEVRALDRCSGVVVSLELYGSTFDLDVKSVQRVTCPSLDRRAYLDCSFINYCSMLFQVCAGTWSLGACHQHS